MYVPKKPINRHEIQDILTDLSVNLHFHLKHLTKQTAQTFKLKPDDYALEKFNQHKDMLKLMDQYQREIFKGKLDRIIKKNISHQTAIPLLDKNLNIKALFNTMFYQQFLDLINNNLKTVLIASLLSFGLWMSGASSKSSDMA